ncbi:MAG: hypothetical protein H5T84_03360 [Thermoleophilia bacterium]|nr:hypothetical protein [Thermoleophilia bacterium]
MVGLGVILLASTVALYAIHYAIFRDAHHIFIYLLGDIAFLPLEVLIVGVVIERIISLREKRVLRHKLNMVIGAFFSEVGTVLLAKLLPAMSGASEIRERLALSTTWSAAEFDRARAYARALDCPIRVDGTELEDLKRFLMAKRTFMLQLLENPNLLEHDRFTDLLWAILHLQEELEARPSLQDLLAPDAAHLAGDIRRAYTQLMEQWLDYVAHLKDSYPYLFSLVVRTHPFQEAPSAVVTN